MTYEEYKNKNGLSLDLSRENLSDIYGIDVDFPNLVTLILSNNEIKDISPLKNLTKLKELYINDNKIVDISCLKDMDIHILDISYNQISNIDIIINFPNLQEVIIHDNKLIEELEKFNNLDYSIENDDIEDYLNLTELKMIIKTQKRKRIINNLK